jgi:hypothetical protein
MNSNDLDLTWLQSQLTGAQWHTASSGGQSCVEVAFLARGIVALCGSKKTRQARPHFR